MGIEALSRGAASAIFVESNRTSAKTIERNLATAKAEGKVRVQDAFEFLKHVTQHFDIVFADPPYERTAAGQSFTELLLNNETIPHVLADDGVFVLEKRPQEKLPRARGSTRYSQRSSPDAGTVPAISSVSLAKVSGRLSRSDAA